MNKNPSPKQKNDTIVAFELAWELGYMIALPLVIFALIGRYFDTRFHSSPIFILVGIFFAFFISSYFVWQKTSTLYQEIDHLSSPKKTQKSTKKSKK